MIWSSNLVGSIGTRANSRMTGVDNQARRMLPMNVRGTAPGKVKWSYFGLYICEGQDGMWKKTHIMQSVRKNAVEEHVMGSVQVKAFFYFCVWS